MRLYPTATTNRFATRAPFMGHILLWVRARHRTTAEIQTIGLWTGADHQDFTIDGQVRTYLSAGSFLKMEPIRRQTGLKVRTQRITISQISPEAQMLIRGYDPRHAPVEIHRAMFDPLTDNLIDEPHVLMRGFIDKAPLTTPAKGQAGSISLEIASGARALTKPLARYRSDATMRERSAGDGFRRYAALTEASEVKWGR